MRKLFLLDCSIAPSWPAPRRAPAIHGRSADEGCGDLSQGVDVAVRSAQAGPHGVDRQVSGARLPPRVGGGPYAVEVAVAVLAPSFEAQGVGTPPGLDGGRPHPRPRLLEL